AGHGEDDAAMLIDSSVEGLKSTGRVRSRAGGKIELPGVQRTDHRSATGQPVRERAAAMGALCLHRKQPPGARPENCHAVSADEHSTAFASWNGVERCNGHLHEL